MATFRPCAAVIFDLDGVLLDTEPLYTQATDQVLSPFGKRLSWDLKSQIMGRDMLWGAELVLSELGVPLSTTAYLQQVDTALRELFVGAEAMPGAEAWVGDLVQAGVPVAVGTSSSRARFDLKATRHAWLRNVGHVVCGDDSRVKERKPAPDIFLVAAAELGVAAQRCVVFEDSPSGVAAAKSAGMQVVGLLAPGLEPRALQHADLVIQSYREVRVAQFGFAECGFG